ncbi:SurA N-terminal domain-containing protein [Desulfurobacterium thermolithotrophum]|uniref:peptidylprolyl isomerase n=1 Tax=Desulfurobacterium thermolithotrophum TaxID=64160 RepID=UPI0013D59D2E|nr:peptidylprolyl isomerase [Desulfurobacterium thermolithotrophum]
MLSKIRKNMKAFSLPLWIVAASFVGTIFLVWGKGSLTGPSGSEVATVNGEPINLIEFNREYNQLTNQLQQQFGENYRKLFPDKEIKIAALQRLINRKLVLEEAKKEGIQVSDWAVAERIRSFPFLQKDGKFSEELYKEFLKANRLSPKVFEDKIREDLLIEKVMAVIDRAPSVTTFELQNLYRKTFGKREFKYKLFLKKDYKPSVSEKELREFYRENISQFKEKTGKKYFLIKIPKSQKGSEGLARKAYNLAKLGKVEKLNDFHPQQVNDKKLISEKFKDKNFGFYSDESNYYVFFKKEGEKAKPFETVKKDIEKILKEKKALELAKKSAEEFLKKGLEPKEKTKPLDRDQFFEMFKPINPQEIENIFSSKKGKRFLLVLTNGYGIFEPITDLKAEKMEKEKMEKLKQFILDAKKQSDYQNFLNLLRQKANIKVNEKFFK